MEPVWVIAALAVFSGPILLSIWRREFDIFSPRVVFVGTYAYLGFYGAMSYLFFDRPFEHPSNHMDLLDPVLLLTLTGLLGAVAGIWIVDRTQSAPVSTRDEIAPAAIERVSAMFMVVSLTGFYVGVLAAGPSIFTGSYEVFGEIYRRYSFFLNFSVILEVAAAAYVSARIVQGKRMLTVPWWTVLGAYSLTWIFFGTRSAVLSIAFPILVAVHFSGRKLRLRFLIPAGLALVALFNVMGVRRSVQEGDVNVVRHASASEKGSFGLEYEDIYTVLFLQTRAMVPNEIPYQMGRSYLVALQNLLPSFARDWIFEETVTDVAVDEIVYSYSPEGKLGFFTPAEAFVNFGDVGPFLVMFVLAAALQLCYRRTGLLSPIAVALYGPLLVRMTTLLRNGFFSSFKGVAYAVLAAFLIGFVARRLTRRQEAEPGAGNVAKAGSFGDGSLAK